MAAPQAPVEIPMPPTMGACLVGSYLSSVFYGVTLLQTYQYFNHYWGRDAIYLPILVGTLTALDTFGVIANMHSMWFYLITNYNNPIAILTIDWSLTFSVVATAIVGFLVQVFFAYRVWIVSERKPWIPLGILLLALASLVLAVWYMVLLFLNGSLLYIPTVTFLSTSSLACGFAADIVIASSMTMYLLKGRRMGMRHTKGIVNKLIIYTINTGLITTTCQLLTLVLGEASADTFYNTIFYFPLSKCYINSMLAFLNARESLRGNNKEFVSLELAARNTAGQTSTDVPSTRITDNTLIHSVAESNDALDERSKAKFQQSKDYV